MELEFEIGSLPTASPTSRPTASPSSDWQTPARRRPSGMARAARERSDHEVERVEADAGAGLGGDGRAPGHGLWIRQQRQEEQQQRWAGRANPGGSPEAPRGAAAQTLAPVRAGDEVARQADHGEA